MESVNKFRVLLEYERGDLKLSQASEILGARCASDVMKSLVAYRAHLPYLVEQSDLLAKQHNTQGDRRAIVQSVADRLGITPRQVNRMMKNTNITTPTPYKAMMRGIRHSEAQEKWHVRFSSALSVIAGLDTMDRAAEVSEVSSRQMYRWVTKLLLTQDLPLKDLKRMQLYLRREVADRIEETQGEYFELHINKRGNGEKEA